MPETIIRVDKKIARKLEPHHREALEFIERHEVDAADVVAIRHIPGGEFNPDQLVFELYERDAKGRVRAEDDPDHPDDARKPKTYESTAQLSGELPSFWDALSSPVKKP